MDQIKIGKFIAACRKASGFTQAQLAERLNITDRAVSKWETGKTLPDSSIMLELCSIFKITVNDLLSGEVVTVDDYNQQLEKNLLEMVKQKEANDKKLLRAEIVLGIATAVPCFVILLALAHPNLIPMADWLRVVAIFASITPFFVACFYCIRIEQTAGYYECAKCGHKYVPTYSSVLWAPHVNRTRYMRCPQCNKKSWQKKVISKE